MSSSSSTPVVTRDPRFRAGRRLLETGQPSEAVNCFSILLAEAKTKFGDAHLETAPAYYEYGNALLRHDQRQTTGAAAAEEAKHKQTKAKNAAEAAERRAKEQSAKNDDDDDGDKKPAAKSSSTNDDKENAAATAADDDEFPDVELALEMMENAWSIVEEAAAAATSSSSSSPAACDYADWIASERPRILTGIGDAMSSMNRHADAADAYVRAMKFRQDAVNALLDSSTTATPTVQHLQTRRRLVEIFILIAEELLACPAGQDVVVTESQTVLVPAAERVNYARGYYDKARDELQETVLVLGQMAATTATAHKDDDKKKESWQEEKENVCFAATMVMAMGQSLAALDDQELQEQEEHPPAAKKKAKTT